MQPWAWSSEAPRTTTDARRVARRVAGRVTGRVTSRVAGVVARGEGGGDRRHDGRLGGGRGRGLCSGLAVEVEQALEPVDRGARPALDRLDDALREVLHALHD